MGQALFYVFASIGSIKHPNGMKQVWLISLILPMGNLGASQRGEVTCSRTHSP